MSKATELPRSEPGPNRLQQLSYKLAQWDAAATRAGVFDDLEVVAKTSSAGAPDSKVAARSVEADMRGAG